MQNRPLYTLDTLEMLVVMAADGSSEWSTEKKADIELIELIGVDEGFGCACANEYRSKRCSRYWVGLR